MVRTQVVQIIPLMVLLLLYQHDHRVRRTSSDLNTSIWRAFAERLQKVVVPFRFFPFLDRLSSEAYPLSRASMASAYERATFSYANIY